MIHRLRSVVTTVALAGAMSCAHPHHGLAQAAPATPPTLTGTWTVGLIGDHVIPMVFVLDQQGTAVSGALGFIGKDYPLSGEVSSAGRFSFTAKFPASVGPDGVHGTDLTDVVITGAWDEQGQLAGEFRRAGGDMGHGLNLKWKAERARPAASGGAAAPADGVTLEGAWAMTIVEAQLQVGVTLTQRGTRLTGAATSDHLGPVSLEDTFRDGMVTLVGHGSQGGQDLRMDFSGRYTAGGTLTGEVVSPVGTMTWTAARVRP